MIHRIRFSVVFFLFLSPALVPAKDNPLPILEDIRNDDSFHCTIPKLSGCRDPQIEKKINRLFQRMTYRLYEAHKDLVTDSVFEYDSRYGIAFHHHDILSVTFEQMLMAPKLAHPFDAVQAVTLDMTKGDVLTLDQLFRSDQSYKNRLKTLMLDYLKTNEEMLGLYPHAIESFQGIKKDQGFYLSPKGLVIFYPTYEYTPRPSGPLYICLPISRLQTLLLPGLKRRLTSPVSEDLHSSRR